MWLKILSSIIWQQRQLIRSWVVSRWPSSCWSSKGLGGDPPLDPKGLVEDHLVDDHDAIGWQSSWWSSEGLVDDQQKPHLPTPHCAHCHSHRSSLNQLPTNSAQLVKTHNLNEANISVSVTLCVNQYCRLSSIEERTHQCQTWQAVDAPHAGERESGSLLAATAH